MKKLTLALALLLTACKTVPVPPGVESAKIPDLPAYYQQRAEKLPPITDPSMGGVTLDSTEASKKYNDVSHKYNGLLDLYNCVKESINSKKVPDTCGTK